MSDTSSQTFNHQFQLLCECPHADATPAIRAIENLGQALHQVSKTFSPGCPQSELLVTSLLQMMQPLKTTRCQEYKKFNDIMKNQRHLRGQRIFVQKQPSALGGAPVLRRTVSSSS